MISVIVPVYNESDKIDRFIDHMDVFDDEFEVIFSVSGDDDTFEKIRDRGYKPIRSIKGRGNQIINGIVNSTGEIILILHADTFFKENPKEVLHETFNDVKERIINLVDDDNNEEDIKISEEDIVISKSFDDEGDVN